MYTWFDALINYYSAIAHTDQKKFWPADMHVIGKDIAWFHSIIWPIMLHAAEIALPKQIYVHGMILAEDGKKMSKSLGNVVDPNEILAKYPLDSFRYYLLRAIPAHGDGRFSEKELIEKHNAELGNSYGNLIMRVLKLYLKDNAVYAVGSYRNSQGRFSPWKTINGNIPANTVPNNDKHCFANGIFVNGSDEYIAGTQNNPTTALAMATIWKNGAATMLTDGTVSVGVAIAVFVVGSDVYVAGYEQEDYFHGGATFAKYWKNGVAVKLATVSSAATGIAVYGTDVYVSGWEHNGTNNVAKYWKNGVSVNLTNGTYPASANGIIVK